MHGWRVCNQLPKRSHTKRNKKWPNLYLNTNKKENNISHLCLQNSKSVFYLLGMTVSELNDFYTYVHIKIYSDTDHDMIHTPNDIYKWYIHHDMIIHQSIYSNTIIEWYVTKMDTKICLILLDKAIHSAGWRVYLCH